MEYDLEIWEMDEIVGKWLRYRVMALVFEKRLNNVGNGLRI